MKKLGLKGMRTLKAIHLVLVMMWVIGVAGMWSLSWIKPGNADELSMLLDCIMWLDSTLTIPGAILTVVVGIIYGLFTNWGFFKFRWITVKWIIGITVILVGTFYFHPTQVAAIEVVNSTPATALTDPTVTHAFAVSHSTSLIQVAALIFLVIISVFKPWNKKTKKVSVK